MSIDKAVQHIRAEMLEAAERKDDLTTVLQALESIKPLLSKLAHHHRSQAKGAPSVSENYHRQLANELCTALGWRHD